MNYVVIYVLCVNYELYFNYLLCATYVLNVGNANVLKLLINGRTHAVLEFTIIISYLYY